MGGMLLLGATGENVDVLCLTFRYKYNSVIFMHGCFWHRHKGCKNATSPKTKIIFWREKFKANVERDRKVQKELNSMGWSIQIIWECETSDIGSVTKIIGNFF